MLLQLGTLGNRLGYQAEAYHGEASVHVLAGGSMTCSLFYARRIADLHVPTLSTRRPARQRMCPVPLDTVHDTSPSISSSHATSSTKMPTVEDYFDDDSDLPLPSSSSRPHGALSGSGLQGALLEEISTDDPDVPELDYDLLADQGRGVYGEGNKAPAPRPGGGLDLKGKGVARGDEQRPMMGGGGPGGGPNIDPKSAMGGFMGDMMKLQKAEDERLEKLRRQMGGATIAANPEVYKE